MKTNETNKEKYSKTLFFSKQILKRTKKIENKL